MNHYPLVGMRFNPPAEIIVGNVPRGTVLVIQPEPENPWDSAALKVLLDLRSLSVQVLTEHLAPALAERGSDIHEIMHQEGEFFTLGHVGATGRGPCLKAGLPGNLEAKQAMDSMAAPKVTLAFMPSGLPVVHIEEGGEAV